MCVCVCVCIYIYIYIYIERERERVREREIGSVPKSRYCSVSGDTFVMGQWNRRSLRLSLILTRFNNTKMLCPSGLGTRSCLYITQQLLIIWSFHPHVIFIVYPSTHPSTHPSICLHSVVSSKHLSIHLPTSNFYHACLSICMSNCSFSIHLSIHPSIHSFLWHSNGAFIETSCHKSLGCGFESDSYLCVWDVSLGWPTLNGCSRCDQHWG